MNVIIVSGTPGTGKTTVAKAVARRKKYDYIDVKKLIKKEKLAEYYDTERKCDVVDIKRLISALVRLIKEHKGTGMVIDSHLSHYLPKKYVDLCIVTKCSLPELKKRLEKRGYAKGKVRENLDSEIFDICRVEALEKGHRVITLDTDKPYSIDSL